MDQNVAENPQSAPLKKEDALSEAQMNAVTGGTGNYFSPTLPTSCPDCGSSNLAFLSLGCVCKDCGCSITKTD